jgi:adenine deaminase
VKYDIVIRNGIIVDGTRSPLFKANIGIIGGTITVIKDLSDIHNHSDLSILETSTANNYILHFQFYRRL